LDLQNVGQLAAQELFSMIDGAGRTRNLAVILVACSMLAACARAGDVTTSPSPTATATPEPTPTTQPTPDPALKADVVVKTVVDHLGVRALPGADQEDLGFLASGSVAFVIDHAVTVDGIPWYPLSGLGVPIGSGCPTAPEDQPIACPAWRGWVAGASAEGAPGIERTTPPDCPKPGIDGILEAGFTYRLICWSGQELTFRAYWPEIPPDAGLGGACEWGMMDVGWLLCQNINYNVVTSTQESMFLQGLSLSIDPDSGFQMPKRGRWVRLTGHFDDPAAQECAGAANTPTSDPVMIVFECRLQFVPTSVAVESGS
jgi:hypothetical protein